MMSLWSVLRRGLGATDEPAAERARQELPTFEQLEPRVLLSADPLGLGANDPYDDDGLAETAIVIEFDPTEPSGDHEPADDQTQWVSPDEPTTDRLDRATPGDQAISEDPIDLPLSQIEHASTLPATHLTDEHTLTETAVPSGDGVGISAQLDLFTPDLRAAGISEARAPPAGYGYGSTHSIYSPYTTSDDGFSSSSVEAVPPQSVPTLPGLRLADPHTNFQDQVIYVDFDGAKDAVYNGPVTVGPFDVPAFSLEGTQLAGLGDDVITATYNDADDGTGTPAGITDIAGIVFFVDIFYQDFESGLGPNETTAGAFTINNTNAPLNNGTLMMGHPGTYANGEYSYYELTVDLTGLTNVQIQFDYAGHIEDGFDGFNVQASTSAISPPAHLIAPLSGLPYTTLDPSFGLAPEIGTTGYDSEGVLDSGIVVFDLSAFDGQVVTIRLQFGSDGSATNPGINIDNLRVTATDVNGSSAEIHGQKWNDLDDDGVQDPDEPGLNGWVIELFDDQGALVATQTTADMDLDGNGTIDPETERGLYWFTGLVAGTYTVGEVMQPGWEQTSPGGGAGNPILITELNLYSLDWIEIQNVSGQTVNTTGWQVVVSQSPYTDTSTVNSVTWNLPASMAAGDVSYRTNGPGDNYWGSNLFWTPGPGPGTGWAMVLDNDGDIVDWVGWGWTDAELASFNVPVGSVNVSGLGTEWTGSAISNVDSTGTGAGSIQRIGNSDNNSSADFIWSISTSQGVQNTGLNFPFFHWVTGDAGDGGDGVNFGMDDVGGAVPHDHDDHDHHDSHVGSTTIDPILSGDSRRVIGPHHADAGHGGPPNTHFFAETGDSHHFAWLDR
ncbi:MAG: LEPR-XLL domain-containing protein, partial [Planctomycetes bacterium]|nr:LEPR-XLL domain-containing protein [Planctomycetota bacterium]